MKINFQSRKIVAILSSSAGMVQQATQIVVGFVYRTIFLMVLAKEYFGINGLFTHILQMFSITELGIGVALMYSMHKYYAKQDMDMIRGLITFYKKVYRLVALAVLLLGLCFFPFINSVVDVSQVPADVNIGRVYFLFLIQSVVGYLYIYKRSILEASQKQYIDYLFNSLVLIIGYVVRTAALLIWKNFELLLLLGIASDILMEWTFYLWVGHRYRDVFNGKGSVPREEKREIYKNTAGLMCHKIGTIVVASTDSIILSKYVSLAAVGIYSNYVTLVSAVYGLTAKAFFGLQPTVTNYVVANSREDSRELYFKILYINMWLACFTTVCLYLLLNPFIGEIWLDKSFLFSREVVMLICFQHYLQMARLTTHCFISSCGLFNRDKIRPLVESIINLTISVLLVKRMGIVGVFVGTCVSGLVTYFWREPYLILHKTLGGGYGKHLLTMFFWTVLTVAMCLLGDAALRQIPDSVVGFTVKLLAAGIGSNLLILLLTFRSEGFRYVWNMLAGILRNRGIEESD